MGDQPKFKVGDRAWVSAGAYYQQVAGRTVVVVEERDPMGDYWVRADDGTEGWAGEKDLSPSTAPAVTGEVPQFVKEALIAAFDETTNVPGAAALQEFARRLGLILGRKVVTTLESI